MGRLWTFAENRNLTRLGWQRDHEDRLRVVFFRARSEIAFGGFDIFTSHRNVILLCAGLGSGLAQQLLKARQGEKTGCKTDNCWTGRRVEHEGQLQTSQR